MSEAVTMPSLMMMTSTFSEELLAKDTDTHTHTHTQTLASSFLNFQKQQSEVASFIADTSESVLQRSRKK